MKYINFDDNYNQSINQSLSESVVRQKNVKTTRVKQKMKGIVVCYRLVTKASKPAATRGFAVFLPGRDGTGQCYTQIAILKNNNHAHLYFSSLNHGAMQTVSCALRISTICECYKTETLHAKTDKTCIINSFSNSCNDMMTLEI